eukprot:TRINITY_DN49606_c0_g1_i1.p1 TRINITY_DN49606_c0_g1~~TRINITY_DN49606_c0_g1_i1.p1  ORF type:complete len:543 (+),score=107.60 TRINITY_DN49606_c0_g1_i1:99-1631(+)
MLSAPRAPRSVGHTPQQVNYGFAPQAKVSLVQTQGGGNGVTNDYRTRSVWTPSVRSVGAAKVAPRSDSIPFAKKADSREIFTNSDLVGSGSDDDSCGSIVEDNAIRAMVKSDRFTAFVGSIITLNTLSMALETDLAEYTLLWTMVNNVFTAFWFFEILARLYTYGKGFFCPVFHDTWGWNIFDLSIVILSVLDQWVQPLVTAIFFPDSTESPFTRYVMLLRMVRILRILRVARLFQQAPQLMLLVRGVMESMQLVFWIAVLLFAFVFVISILLTDVVGNSADEYENPELIRTYFGGVMTCIITLFQFLTLDNWAQISAEVVKTTAYMQIVFDLYIFLSAFAMLSLLTGVIADHLGEVSSELKDDAEKQKEEDLSDFIKQVFKENDVGDRFNEKQFKETLSKPEVTKGLSNQMISIEKQEIDDFWTFLNADGDEWVTMEECIVGMTRLRGDVEAKDLIKLRCAAERVRSFLLNDEQETVLREVSSGVADIESRISYIDEAVRGFAAHIAPR